MEKFQNKIIKEILEYYENLWSISHVSSLARWDIRTNMPKAGSKARGKALAKMGSLRQKLFLKPEFIDLIKKAEDEKELNDYEQGVVRVLGKSLEKYEKLPKEFLEKKAEITTEAHGIWEKAREDQDFKKFAPILKEIVELARQEADYLGYEAHPYDPLVDSFEEGLTTKQVSEYFESIKNPLKEIFEKVQKNENIAQEHVLLDTHYFEEEMKKLNKKLLEELEVDRTQFRDDIAVHPFTTTLGINDARITTRYNDTDFKMSFLPTAHEFGHALHGLQCDPDLARTPLSGHGMSIGESQSRFIENLIARSKPFLARFTDDMKELSPEIKDFINKEGVDGVYRYFNAVQPGFIRVEGNEITYHFHILLRFEIEKELIAGNIKVEELPEIWNSKMKEYLGIVPPNDSLGVLQDVHWSEGYFGYFPTYSMGTFISQMWSAKMQEELGTMDDLLNSDDGIRKIKKWLGDNVHKYGCTYTMNGLLEKIVGSRLDPQPMLDYLEEKYVKV